MKTKKYFYSGCAFRYPAGGEFAKFWAIYMIDILNNKED